MAQVQAFQDHIKELRKRVLWVGIALMATAGVAYALHQPIIKFLQKPYGQTLVYTSPAGSFEFIIQLSVIAGMFVALPVIIYQTMRFLEPALPNRITNGMMLKVIGSSCFLALLGICFGFFVMIPISLKFFLGFTMEEVKPLITAEEYLKFVLNHMLTFAIAFQIPMIFWFINRIKPIKPSKLLKYQKHVIVGSFGLALVLPFTYDPLSQFLVAMPVIFLYYMSILIVWLANRKITYPAESEPQPQPDTTKVFADMKSVPLPLAPLAFTQVNKSNPVIKSMTMDGFVGSGQLQAPKPTLSMATKVNPQPTISTVPRTVAPNNRQPTKSNQPRFIDGISRPMPSAS